MYWIFETTVRLLHNTVRWYYLMPLENSERVWKRGAQFSGTGQQYVHSIQRRQVVYMVCIHSYYIAVVLAMRSKSSFVSCHGPPLFGSLSSLVCRYIIHLILTLDVVLALRTRNARSPHICVLVPTHVGLMYAVPTYPRIDDCGFGVKVSHGV